MEAQLNIEVRSRILEYSLVIENLINDLLLLNLGIYNEKEKTRLFSNKGKLTFQNKIDLLFDIYFFSFKLVCSTSPKHSSVNSNKSSNPCCSTSMFLNLYLTEFTRT